MTSFSTERHLLYKGERVLSDGETSDSSYSDSEPLQSRNEQKRARIVQDSSLSNLISPAEAQNSISSSDQFNRARHGPMQNTIWTGELLSDSLGTNFSLTEVIGQNRAVETYDYRNKFLFSSGNSSRQKHLRNRNRKLRAKQLSSKKSIHSPKPSNTTSSVGARQAAKSATQKKQRRNRQRDAHKISQPTTTTAGDSQAIELPQAINSANSISEPTFRKAAKDRLDFSAKSGLEPEPYIPLSVPGTRKRTFAGVCTPLMPAAFARGNGRGRGRGGAGPRGVAVPLGVRPPDAAEPMDEALSHATSSSSLSSAGSLPVIEHVNVPDSADDEQVAVVVAAALHEPKTEILERAVQVLGRARVIELYRLTEATEERGGLLIANGMRRRTPGGCFIQLLREHTDAPLAQQILPDNSEFLAQLAQRKQRYARRWNRTRPYYPRSRGGRWGAGDECEEAQSMDTSEPARGESVAPGLAIAQHAMPSAARAAARDEEPEEGELSVSLTDGSSDESAEEEQDLQPPLVTAVLEVSLAHEPTEAAAARAACEEREHSGDALCVSPAPHFEQLFAASAPLDAQVTAQPSANGALHSHLHSAPIRSAPLEDGELSD